MKNSIIVTIIFLSVLLSSQVSAIESNDQRIIPPILCILLLCDDSEASNEAFFEHLINANHVDDFGLVRQIPLAPLSSRESKVYGSNSYPIIVRNESQSADVENTLNGWAGAAKYGYFFIRQGSMDELEEIQNADPDVLAVHYESPADPQGPYNSTWAIRGSGGRFSHGQLFLKLGNVTTGGDIANPPDSYNQADFPQWVGHVVPTVPATLSNNENRLSNDDSQYITYELDEDIDDQWFTLSTSDNCGPTDLCTNGAFIWTPNSPTSTFADEASDPNTGFSNAERVRIRGVDHANNTVTVSRAKVPGGSNIFGSSAANGASFARQKGDKIMLIPPGQGSVKYLNDAMNMHPVYGFEDANGNTYYEAMQQFYQGNNLKRDANGNIRSVTLDASASDVTEEFHPNSGRFLIDFDGDGKEDDGYVAGINRWKEAHELGTSTYTGLPIHGGGGTGEAVLQNMEFQQIEHVSDASQFADDQNQTFHSMGAHVLRSLYHKFYASHAHYNACVTKHSTLAFNDSGGATTNDAFYTKMGLCLLALTNIAPLNFNNNNIENRDNWWTIGAVNLNTDTALSNTPQNQSAIKLHRGWGGSPISPIQNISDTDFDSLTPAFEWDFSSDVTADWSINGSDRMGTEITYDAVNKRMVVRNLAKSFSFGAVRLQPRDEILTSNDVNKDIVIRYHIGANTHGEIQQDLGDGSSRVKKDIYLNPDQAIHFDTAFRTINSDVNSGFRRILKIALPRLNDSETINPEFYVYKIQVFKGTNIDNSVWTREFESMVAVCNGTSVQKTIPIAAGKSLRFPIMTTVPSQLPTWASSGELFNSNNPLILPAKQCGILIKKV